MTNQLTTAQLKKAIIDEISHLNRNDTREVLNSALQEIPGRRFITAANGTSLSLELISDDILLGMHKLIQSKLIFEIPPECKDD